MATAALAATATPTAASEASGMPQLDFSTYPNQIFWLAVALVIIYFMLTRIALPRIGSVLAERKGTVTNDIAAAEEMKRKAQEAERAYNQALADARAEAARIVAKTRAEIQADLDEAIAEADKKIAAKSAESEKRISEIRASAQESVTEVATDTAKELVAVLGGKANARSITAAIAARQKG
jgi:F-type H+-transporting ATPase subunit b